MGNSPMNSNKQKEMDASLETVSQFMKSPVPQHPQVKEPLNGFSDDEEVWESREYKKQQERKQSYFQLSEKNEMTYYKKRDQKLDEKQRLQSLNLRNSPIQQPQSYKIQIEEREVLRIDQNSIVDQSLEHYLPKPKFSPVNEEIILTKKEEESSNFFELNLTKCDKPDIDQSIIQNNIANQATLSSTNQNTLSSKLGKRQYSESVKPTYTYEKRTKGRGPKGSCQSSDIIEGLVKEKRSLARSTIKVTKINEAEIREYIQSSFSQSDAKKLIDELEIVIPSQENQKKQETPSTQGKTEQNDGNKEKKLEKSRSTTQKACYQFSKDAKERFFTESKLRSIIFVIYGQEILDNSIQNLRIYNRDASVEYISIGKNLQKKAFIELLDWAIPYSGLFQSERQEEGEKEGEQQEEGQGQGEGEGEQEEANTQIISTACSMRVQAQVPLFKCVLDTHYNYYK